MVVWGFPCESRSLPGIKRKSLALLGGAFFLILPSEVFSVNMVSMFPILKQAYSDVTLTILPLPIPYDTSQPGLEAIKVTAD